MTARGRTAKHLTVRNVRSDVAKALEAERRRRGASLNQTVLDLLRRSLGLQPGQQATNGLERFAGRWSDADLREFERATEHFEQVDDEVWR